MSLMFQTDGPAPLPGETLTITYKAFGLFRRRVAALFDIDLYRMEGFGGDVKWDKFRNLPLYPLLDHADNEGLMTPAECEKVYPELEKILWKWPRDQYRQFGERLVELMQVCVEHKQPLLFC